MIKVGLTGNIGSGKSMVSRIFEILGVPVFHADTEAKKFLTHPKVLTHLESAYGDVVVSNGVIDKKALAAIVFNDKIALDKLNGLIHPLVREAFFSWIETKKEYPYIIQEAAILFESGFNEFFDKVITVSCDEALAIKRVVERDGVSEAQVKERLQNQMSQDEKVAKSDFMILNNEDELIIPQVLEMHRQLSFI